MRPAVVPPAVPYAKDRHVAAMVSEKHARCIRQRVQAADVRHRYPSSHEKADRCIVVSVSKSSDLVAETIIDLAGKKQTQQIRSIAAPDFFLAYLASKPSEREREPEKGSNPSSVLHLIIQRSTSEFFLLIHYPSLIWKMPVSVMLPFSRCVSHLFWNTSHDLAPKRR
jgi:hypothetical protein